jgi:hypothetical protein
VASTSTIDRTRIEEVERARQLDKAALLAMVEPDANEPVVDQGQLVESRRSVWAIIGHIESLLGDVIRDDVEPEAIVQAADDFAIPVVEVVAALTYYAEHRQAIDWWRARQVALSEALGARGRPVFG